MRMAIAGGETAEPMRNRGKKGARDGRAGALELGGNRRLATGKRRTEEARREAGLFFVGGVEKDVERYLFPSQ